MKTTKTFEIEIERHGVTPAQFLAYLRSMQKKHPEMAADFDLNMFSREGWSSNYSNALPTERPCEAERDTDKPYEKQTYIRNFDGTTYNEIIEFDFNDEKTGYGYYYTVQIDVAEEDREANTAENVAAIIRRRAEQANRQEVKAEKAEQEANEAERSGYTAQWWIDSKRTEAATLRREAAETRAAIEAAKQPQEAQQEAPAAEAEQQPTENAAQEAAEAAHEAADAANSAAIDAPGTEAAQQAAQAAEIARRAARQARAAQKAGNLEAARQAAQAAKEHAEAATQAATQAAEAEPIELDLRTWDQLSEPEQAAPAPDPDAATLAPADAAQVWDEDGETVTAMWRAIHEADAELQRVQDPEHIQAQADAMTWHIPDTDWTAVITAAMQGVEL